MFPLLIHRYLFLLAVCALGSDMFLGEVPASVPQIVLGANWFLEGNFKEKLCIFKKSRMLWVLASFFILHLIGMLYSSEIHRGLEDLRIKMPLLFLPMILLTSKPLNAKELKVLFYFCIGGALVSSFWCLIYSMSHPYLDPRNASRFLSHIRYGLMLDMMLCIIGWLMREEKNRAIRITLGMIAVYLIFFMIRISLITGLVIFIGIAVVWLLIVVFRQPLRIKLASLAIFFIAIFSLFYAVRSEWNKFNYVDPSPANAMQLRSASGRPYDTLTNKFFTENGFYVTYNIQHFELIEQWRNRTHTEIYSLGKKGNVLILTAIRYLTSKGLTKDSAGLAQLTDADIENIRNGVNNYRYMDASAFRKRLKEIFYEYHNYQVGNNPSGNTMMMRFEFWKAAGYIIRRNLAFGVGTGDATKAFHYAYQRTNTNLAYEWRLRSHNQFLAILVCFGITGFLVFLIWLIYPVVRLRRRLHPLYFFFFGIAVSSFLTEDTLESQAGVTFFVYFNTLFIWLAESERKREAGENDLTTLTD